MSALFFLAGKVAIKQERPPVAPLPIHLNPVVWVDPFKQPDAPGPRVDAPPSRIIVGPYVFTIHYRTEKTMPGQYGSTSMVDEKILLQRDLGFGQMRETLLHELEHAAIFAAAGSERPDTDGDTEDEFIEANAATLITILRDNPTLVTWLTKRPY